jgi:hypothetical protein
MNLDKLLSTGLVANVYLLENDKIIKVQDKSERVDYEVFFSKLINETLDNNICIHFSRMIKEVDLNDKHGIIMNKIDHNLTEMFKNKVIMDEIKSFTFQIIYSIMVINKILNSCHNDVKYLNIMYDDIDQEYIYYSINDYTYKVKSYGKKFYLIDYGRIRSLRKSSDKRTIYCVKKNTDLGQFSKLLLNMYLLEIVGKFRFPFKDNNNVSKHDNLERKRIYLYKLFKKNKLKLNKSKLYVVDDEIFDFFDSFKNFKDENIFIKLFDEYILKSSIETNNKNILINEFKFL